jgi:hypothetical protein
MICHINKCTTLGATLCMNINWLQMHAGISVPVFESKNQIDYIQGFWFHEIKKFLNGSNATLNIKSAWIPKLLRHNDSFIMDKIEQSDTTKSSRKIINK